MNQLAANHVQTERVKWVFQAQHDLAAGGRTREPAYVQPQRKLQVKVSALRAKSGAAAPVHGTTVPAAEPGEPVQQGA
jgi:hypothetical protein